MKRLGLFGGSFDPVHLGHLVVARAAQEELKLDRLVFIPAAVSPFKPEREPAPATERLALLRLALVGQTWCEVDDLEVRRGGVSYTIDTVREYVRRYPGALIFWLIGADHVSKLSDWHEAETLARMVHFVIVPRPGEVEPAPPSSFKVSTLRGYPLAVSSSEIRERVRQGQPIDFLTGPLVAEAIHKKRLYF